MDHWHPHSARTAPPDAIARWAELEARTPSARHDLRLRFAASNDAYNKSALRFPIIGELLFVAVDFCFHVRSR